MIEFLSSPMSTFNRSNPFIILLKDEYHEINDSIQEYTKNAIKGILIASIITICSILLTVFTTIKYGISLFHTICFIAPILGLIFGIIKFYQNIKYYRTTHRAMILFTKLHNSTLDEVLELNTEDLLKGLHYMYELKGELLIVTQYSLQLFNLISFATTVCIIMSITSVLTSLI